jgi:hypothetical protein
MRREVRRTRKRFTVDVALVCLPILLTVAAAVLVLILNVQPVCEDRALRS